MSCALGEAASPKGPGLHARGWGPWPGGGAKAEGRSEGLLSVLSGGGLP